MHVVGRAQRLAEQGGTTDHEHRDEQERAPAASLPGARVHRRHGRTARLCARWSCEAYDLAMLGPPGVGCSARRSSQWRRSGCTRARGGPSHASSPGLIVFASDRAKLNNGEIYSLAPGTQARDVTHSLAGEHDLAVAPRGDLIAFWSNRSGFDRVYLAHSDGSRVRLVARGSLRARRERIRATAPGSVSPRAARARRRASRSASCDRRLAIDVRPATARALPPCGVVLPPSPDGTLIACSRSGNGPVSVYDAAGTRALQRSRTRGRDLVQPRLADGPPTSTTPGRSVGSSTRPVARVAHVSGAPLAWSPDGGLLRSRRGTLAAASPIRATSGRRAGDLPGLLRRRCVVHARRPLRSRRRQHGQVRYSSRWPADPPIPGFAPAGSAVWSRDGRAGVYRDGPVDPLRPGVTIPVLRRRQPRQHPRLAGRFPVRRSRRGRSRLDAGRQARCCSSP